IQARGATPVRPVTFGWQPPSDALHLIPPGPSESTIVEVAGAVVPASPADTPATAVPWNENCRSTASRPSGPEPGPGNALAPITFGVVRFVWPFGKPAGYE